MRFARRLAGLSLIVLGGGCDSTQPLQVQEQTLQLSFKAVNSQLKTFNVWDVFLDNNGDEVPDGITHLWCENVPPPNPISNEINPSTVPWNYTLEIKVLRAGETVAETITSPEALNVACPPATPGMRPPCNLTSYDTLDSQAVAGPANHADICTVAGALVNCPFGGAPPDGGDRYSFRNARRISGANQDLMTTEPSPLFLEIQDDASPPLGLGEGLCSLGDQGPVNIDGLCQENCDGAPEPWQLVIEKGDTIIVQAVLATSTPQGGSMSSLIEFGSPPNSLAATMTLDGRALNLVGTPSGQSVSFSYTSR